MVAKKLVWKKNLVAKIESGLGQTNRIKEQQALFNIFFENVTHHRFTDIDNRHCKSVVCLTYNQEKPPQITSNHIDGLSLQRHGQNDQNV